MQAILQRYGAVSCLRYILAEIRRFVLSRVLGEILVCADIDCFATRGTLVSVGDNRAALTTRLEADEFIPSEAPVLIAYHGDPESTVIEIYGIKLKVFAIKISFCPVNVRGDRHRMSDTADCFRVGIHTTPYCSEPMVAGCREESMALMNVSDHTFLDEFTDELFYRNKGKVL